MHYNASHLHFEGQSGSECDHDPRIARFGRAFVYVTNQGSNSVSIYAVDSNGTLTSKGEASTGGNPVDVTLIKK